MNIIVPRTCTEIGDEGAEAGTARSADGFAATKAPVWDEIEREAASARATGEFDSGWGDSDEAEGAPADAGRSRPLEAFRESAAYVLLGAPGAGKTIVFETEGERDGCHCVTARDFLTFDVDDTPGWHDTTLFIDGLDEKRAGVADDHLFVLSTGRPMHPVYLATVFVKLARRVGLRAGPGQPGPRLHDLRHAFAVRALESALSTERRDVARHMLTLSTYLGHSNTADTYWYLEATPVLLRQVSQATERLHEGRNNDG